MKLSWHTASEQDLPLLADWNHQLIHDQGHRNPMSVAELGERMRCWLQGEYQALIFSADTEPVAYALFGSDEGSVHLRHFFVRRDQRRNGIGRAVIRILRDEVWPAGLRLTVEVLCQNAAAIAFWRNVGYRDYSLSLEINPD